MEAWRGFFGSFPDYCNVFDEIAEVGDGVVVVRGRLSAASPQLEGSAEWRAIAIDARVDVWEVSNQKSGAC